MKKNRYLAASFFALALLTNFIKPVYSETSLAPIQLPSLYPTDVTPVNIGRERELLRPGLNYYIFKNLPSRLWFNAVIETSQRYESNVFMSRTRYISDYVYRILPNVTVGYELPKKVNIYCNYFVIKDVFVGHSQLTAPTTQSLSWGLRRDFNLTPRTNFQIDWQARELWQTVGLHQFDFIPAMTLTRFVTPRTIVYFNTLLQLRGGQYFVAPTREIDPFYTLGIMHTRGNWLFSAVTTLVTNFRHGPFNDSIPPFSNNSIICDFEVAHPVPKLPKLVAFVRAEPIWNWNGHGEQGISGMDFRLFGGIRLVISKPTYSTAVKNLEQQWQQYPGPAGNQTPPSVPPAEGTSPDLTQPGSSEVPLHTAPKSLQPSEEPGSGTQSKPNQELPNEHIFESAPENI